MRTRLWRYVRTIAAVLGLVVAGLAVPPQLAHAFSAASLSVPIYAHQARSHPDGSVTFEECMPPLSQAYSTQRIMTVDAGGATLTSLAKPSGAAVWGPMGCEDTTVAGYDSTIYTVETKAASNGYTNYRIAAYKFGMLRWNYQLAICPNSQIDGRPKWLMLGYDGNLYAAMSSTCSVPDKLIGINTADGTSRFTPIAFSQDISNVMYWRSRIAAYSGGLVMLDGNALKYYDYNGQSNQASATLPLTSSEYFDDATFAADGTALIAVRKTGITCTGVHRVLTHSPSGTDGGFSTANECPKPGIVRAMPDGGLVMSHQPGYDHYLTRYAANGTLVYTVSIVGVAGYSQVWVAWPQVDANGTVIVVRSGINSSGERHSFVDVVSPTGTMQRVWDTLSLNTPATGEVFRYTQGERFAMEPGAVYIPICANTCSATNPVKVYKVLVSGLGYDYPRSSWIAAQPAQLNYVALGDSFSSGEGVPPFMAGTDTSTDKCHRSVGAYAMLLDADPSLNLNLTSFRACSGATTQTMVSGWNGEGNQLSAITSTTDVVTVTIGGNNVEFATFVENCLTPGTGGCAEGTESYNLVMQRIDQLLLGHLVTLFGQIQTQLTNGNTTAKVYVVGYPRIVVQTGAPCSLLYTLGTDEQDAALQITNALNSRIALVVHAFRISHFPNSC
ncbi:MAG: GDSL-type esterase/lipase family protein [Candidatus Saccharimonadales bacterium]